MKKIMSLFLLVSMSIILVSCSDEKKNEKITNGNKQEKTSNQKELNLKKDHEKVVTKNDLQNALKKEFSLLKDVSINTFNCIKNEDDILNVQCSGDIDLIGNFRDKIVSNINLVNLNGSWKIDNKESLESEIMLKIMGWQTKKTYWEDGSLRSIVYLDNNSLIQGNVKAYDKDGSIITDAFYKDNKPLNGFIKLPSKRDIGFKFEANLTFKDGNIQNGYNFKSNSVDIYRNGKLLDDKDKLYIINYLDKNDQKGLLEGTPESIKYLNDLTEEKKLWATLINGRTIQYINNPTEKMILNAVENNLFAIEFIKNPSELVQQYIVTNLDFEYSVKNILPDVYTNYMNEVFSESTLGTYYKTHQKYNKALEIFNNNQDNSYSQYHLGQMYFEGKGVDRNVEKGIDFFEKSANGGFHWAQNKMGIINFNDKNFKTAVDWFLKSYKQGYSEKSTLNFLLTCYEKIEDLDNLESTAVKLFKLDNSNKVAIKVADFYYKFGNEKKAKDWYSKLTENELFKRLGDKPNNPILKSAIAILDKKTLNENTAKYVLKIADILRFGKNKIEKDYTSAYKYYKKIYNNPNSKTWLTDSYFNLTAYDSAKTNMYEICIDNKFIDPKKIKDIDESMSKCDIEISEKL